ncbi:MAG: glycosyltransferase family 1 protein [Patescibacteria group bacterium]
MRIGIDARFYGPIGKGLGRYTQKLIENLELIDDTNEYFIFLRKENIADYELKAKNFRKVLADYRWYTWEEQIKFSCLLKKYSLDLVHFPHFNVPVFYFGKFIVTIHDLILIHFPTTRSSTLGPFLFWIKFFAYKIVIKSAIFRSQRIIAVSEFTKNDILKNYPTIPGEKIKVTYEACEDYCMLSPPAKDEKVLKQYGIIKPYAIYVGNVYPHKNPERLALAFKKIKNNGGRIKLVFVGSEDYFYSRLKKFVSLNNIKNIIFAGFVPDHELDIIFHNALAYVRPSLYEGFELPPLEAMAKGVPVISSDHSCALEILGESAYYFDPFDVDKIAEAIEKVTGDENLRKDLIKKGYQQTQKYSWKKMAKATLEIYKNAAGKK